jgi:protein-disulfide isomerase
MAQKLFNLLLVSIFIILVLIFSYKKLFTPEVITVPIEQLNTNEGSAPTSPHVSKSLSKADIEVIVKDYITNNPDVLINSLENMQKNKEKETTQKATEYLRDNRTAIETDSNPPILGNKDGDISIVVFYDYNCSYCKKANIETNKIISSDSGVKIILRPIAILGGTSLYAAKASLALQKAAKDHFPAIHNDIMRMQVINEESIKKLTEKYKIDYSIVENEINSYAIKQLITKNFDLARSLGISGAPSYIVNGIFIPGFIPEDKFKQIIMQIRSSDPTKEKTPEATSKK